MFCTLTSCGALTGIYQNQNVTQHFIIVRAVIKSPCIGFCVKNIKVIKESSSFYLFYGLLLRCNHPSLVFAFKI